MMLPSWIPFSSIIKMIAIRSSITTFLDRISSTILGFKPILLLERKGNLILVNIDAQVAKINKQYFTVELKNYISVRAAA